MTQWVPWPTRDGWWWHRQVTDGAPTPAEPVRVRTGALGVVWVHHIGVEFGSTLDDFRREVEFGYVYEWAPLAPHDALPEALASEVARAAIAEAPGIAHGYHSGSFDGVVDGVTYQVLVTRGDKA